MNHRLGVIGYGNMGSWHCENVTNRIEGLDVCAVYDIDEGRRALAREKGFTVYDTEEEFFSSDVDLVLVATPNSFHKNHCISAMEHGKNVISEKPPCLNCEELEEVIAASERTGKLYTVHHNRRFDIDYALMKEIIKKDEIGKRFYLSSRLYGNRGFANAGWKSVYEAGGGLLYDWGIHMIDQVLCLADSEPEYVFAQLQSVRFPEVDDVCRVIIGFENGLRAQIIADLWCYIPEPRWHLSGDDGTATIEKWFGREGKIVKANIKEVDWEQGCFYTPNGLSKTMWPRPKQEIEELELPVPEREPRWEDFYENVVQVIEGKADQLVTHEQIRRSMRVMMAAFESARTGNAVKLGGN